MKKRPVRKKTIPLDLRGLTTEKMNLASASMDQKSALEIVRIINREDAKVATAVKRGLPQIAKAIDLIAAALRTNGRLIYVGTGTSGRIAALDAVECPPTFDIPRQAVQFIIAGGNRALSAAVESNEDSRQAGAKEMARKKPSKRDVVVGIAASGRTPFTLAGLEFARQRGAKTVAVVCNPKSPLGKAAHVEIVTEVGPEVVAGSTRMKAGTAQKMVLNMLTTGAMARLGHIYGNLMVNVRTRNEKLKERAVSIIETVANVDQQTASKILVESDMNLPIALVRAKTGVSKHSAAAALRKSGGRLRQSFLVAEREAARSSKKS